MVLLRKAGEQRVKLGSVRLAVVRRQPHAEQQHLGACGQALPDDVGQVGPGGADGRAAQAVVGTEFQDHDRGLVLAQCLVDAHPPARRGLAADAGVHYAVLRMRALQFVLQQIGPTFFYGDAVSG